MDNFIELKTCSTIRSDLLEFAKDNSTSWKHMNAFDLAMVPMSIVTDSNIKILIKEFKFNLINPVPVIFRMPPWQFYRFHVDAARSCAINMLIDGIDSAAYYGEDTEEEEIMSIQELYYQNDRYYLLNTQQKHAVINRSQTRYMFSVGFFSNVSYNQVRDFILENNL